MRNHPLDREKSHSNKSGLRGPDRVRFGETIANHRAGRLQAALRLFSAVCGRSPELLSSSVLTKRICPANFVCDARALLKFGGGEDGANEITFGFGVLRSPGHAAREYRSLFRFISSTQPGVAAQDFTEF